MFFFVFFVFFCFFLFFFYVFSLVLTRRWDRAHSNARAESFKWSNFQPKRSTFDQVPALLKFGPKTVYLEVIDLVQKSENSEITL